MLYLTSTHSCNTHSTTSPYARPIRCTCRNGSSSANAPDTWASSTRRRFSRRPPKFRHPVAMRPRTGRPRSGFAADWRPAFWVSFRRAAVRRRCAADSSCSRRGSRRLAWVPWSTSRRSNDGRRAGRVPGRICWPERRTQSRRCRGFDYGRAEEWISKILIDQIVADKTYFLICRYRSTIGCRESGAIRW